MALFNFLVSSLLASYPIECSGPILYSLHRGEAQRGFETYLAELKEGGVHDFELLQQAGRALLMQGIQSKDEEIQLMCLFGAGVAVSSELIPILEKGIKSPDIKRQLIALNYLSKLQDDEADALLWQALASPFLVTRLEILLHFAQKNHPAVLNHLHSLIVKVPEEARFVFPQIAIFLEGSEGTRFLKQLLTDKDLEVRLETILAVAEAGRDEFLPTLRLLAASAPFAQQEAAAYALGLLKDHDAIPLLKELAQSNHESVKIAASLSLYKLGERSYLEPIEEEAKKHSLFAIAALGKLKQGSAILTPLLNHPEKDIRLNAALALLAQKEKLALPIVDEILFSETGDFGFWQSTSAGGALKICKSISSASQRKKTYPGIKGMTLQLKEKVLCQCLELGEEELLKVTKKVFEKKQNALVPLLIDLLVNAKSENVIRFLKEWQQIAGAPLIRNYCTLALYLLKESGPYEEQLIAWLKAKGGEELIRFKEEEETDMLTQVELTPEETSQFLVEVCQTLASTQNQAGLEALIHTIAYGNPKNRYALAGLLIRTAE